MTNRIERRKKHKIAGLLCCAVAGLVLPAHAANYYVAPNGSPSGNGSITNPWDLHTGITAKSVVHPGDTIWVRGGTYQYAQPWQFSVNLTGTAAQPIVIRKYPGEWAVWDLGNNGSALVMDNPTRLLGASDSSYVWIWGIEITATGIPRTTSTAGSFGIGSITDIEIHGVGVKFINCYVHDLHAGFGFWSDSSGSELYGSVVGAVGWNGPDRGHGHGIYAQNDGSGLRKYISDNIIYNSFDIGMQWYGSGAALIQNITGDGNVIVNSGMPIGQAVGQLIIAGGGASKQGIVYTNGITFVSPQLSGGFSQIGWGWDGINQDAVIQGNYFGRDIELWHWNSLNFSGNTVQGNMQIVSYQNQSTAGYSLGNNRYAANDTFVLGSSSFDSSGNITLSTGGVSASGWQSAWSPRENSSQFNQTLGLQVIVRPNKYEAGRANISILNPGAQSTVAVDLSQVGGLQTGDRWELRDAQNFRAAPVLSGTYNAGTPVIQVPMTGLTPASIQGWSLFPSHSAPLLGSFVFLGGAAFDGSGPASGPTGNPPTASLTASSNSVTAGTPVTLTWSTSGATSVSLAGFGAEPANGALTITPASTTTYTLTATNANGSVTASQTVTVSASVPSGPGGGTASAAFVALDTTTKGSWKGVYGSDGSGIATVTSAFPSYAQVSVNQASTWVWAGSTTDTRALSQGTGRLASCWFGSDSFSLDVNLTDGRPHSVALYAVDWDSTTRSETVSVLDAATGAVLDSRTLSGFNAGQYLKWNMSGHVTIRVTRTGGDNAVVSGLFFGVPTATSATFLQNDTTTKGSWIGKLGADGSAIAGDSTHLPAYAQLTFTGPSNWTWASTTGDTRALQTFSGASRVAATWFASTFSIDVNLTDGAAHKVSLYGVDWDSTLRAETITVKDAVTGAVLDTRTLSGFNGGQYLSWTISGHVLLTVTKTAGSNAVISGVFFN